MKRVALAALVLLAGVGGLCAAWWVTAQRAFEAEVRWQSQRSERDAAERLATRLEDVRRAESERPYFHYQNLYHDPKGASQGLSVVPSPLANGPRDPLLVAHFQIDAKRRVSLPTLNDDLRELSAKNAGEQRAIRDRLAASAESIRNAAAPLVARVEREATEARASATRIAELEAELDEARRPVQLAAKSKLEVIEPSAFMQNVSANTIFQQLRENPAPAPPPRRAPRRQPPVQIRTTDLEWRTVNLDGRPALMALRAVHTPGGTLVQGLLTRLADGATVDDAVVAHTGEGSAIERTGWRARARHLAALNGERARFVRTFAAVCGVLLLVVMGVLWTLWRVERLATDRARFAATAAHELRTPLASLRLYSDLIAEETDAEKRERYARELASQTERLGRVVANVLEVTRLERGSFALQPRPAPIGPAVEECIDRLRPQLAAAQCDVQLRVAGDLPVVAFDRDALHHVVDNLVDNAEKYSRDVPDRRIDVDVAAEDGGVAITVSDRGPGVPDKLLRAPKPFRRGVSTIALPGAPSGLGLGLYLVDRIVRGHGGAIRTEARPGGGARVRVFLPAFYKP